MTTAFAAKWAIYEALKAQGETGELSTLGTHGGPLQVRPDNDTAGMETRCVYPGGLLWDRPPERTLEDGGSPEAPRWSVGEDDTTTWFVRVAADADEDLRDVEMAAVDIVDAIGKIVAGDRAIAGAGSKSYIVGGQADYSPTDPSRKIVVAMVVIRTQTQFEE